MTSEVELCKKIISDRFTLTWSSNHGILLDCTYSMAWRTSAPLFTGSFLAASSCLIMYTCSHNLAPECSNELLLPLIITHATRSSFDTYLLHIPKTQLLSCFYTATLEQTL